ncbi:MAG TPA: pitrilysin family protein [Bacteroidales bacterium]|nr:pitrilysin family protein [Bacteroidales bacterium]
MAELKRVQPPVFPVERMTMPEVNSTKLSNGIEVYLIESGTEEITRIEFIFRAGQVMEHIPLLASSTNMMLKEGTRNYTAEEINNKLDYFGAFLNLAIDKDMGGMVVYSLNRHQDKVLELCKEILFMPEFPEKEMNALMKKRQQWYRINREKVQNLAYDQLFELMFGKEHPYGRQISEQDYTKLNPGLLKEFHSSFYVPEKMTIIVSGVIPSSTIGVLEELFGSLRGHGNAGIKLNTDLKSSTTKKLIIEKSSAVQTAIRIGSPSINKRHADYHGLKVVDTLLGGYFGSRLMRNIREDKGYTYGIRSNLTSLELSGYKMISTEVGNEYAENTVNEIYKEIAILHEELIKSDELETVRNYMLGEMVRMFDGPFATAESFRSAWEFGFDNSYYTRFAGKIRTIEPEEIRSLAREYYNIDGLHEVRAGRK